MDRKAVHQVHGFRRHFQCGFVCESCLAVRPFPRFPHLFTFTNFAYWAPWRYTSVSHPDYMITEGDSPWRAVPGWHMLLNFEDLMHNSLLGHGSDLCASTVKDMLRTGVLPGNSEDERLELLSADFKVWCKAHKLQCPLGCFTASLFGLGEGFPVLHSKIKAAHVRILLSFLADKCTEVCTGDLHSRLRTACAFCLADFHYICDHNPRWFSHEIVAKVLTRGHMYLECYQRLSYNMERSGIFNYHMCPKHHFFDCRILGAISASAINPRYTHCFLDEDFVGRVARIVRATCSKSCSLRALQRWLLYLGQRWHNLETGGT